jgi:hypothetical protein
MAFLIFPAINSKSPDISNLSLNILIQALPKLIFPICLSKRRIWLQLKNSNEVVLFPTSPLTKDTHLCQIRFAFIGHRNKLENQVDNTTSKQSALLDVIMTKL